MNNSHAVIEVKSMYKKFERDIENLCLEVDDVDACELIEEAHQNIDSILKSLKSDLKHLELDK